jgi:hypothetical protein
MWRVEVKDDSRPAIDNFDDMLGGRGAGLLVQPSGRQAGPYDYHSKEGVVLATEEKQTESA